MKKVMILVSMLALVAGFAFAQEQPYDKATTVKVMRDNVALLGQINTAASKSDFQGAAEKLMLMGLGMSKLLPMAPPKGTKEDWVASVRAFLDAVYKGIGACGVRDQAALNAAVRELRTLNGSSHAAFK